MIRLFTACFRWKRLQLWPWGPGLKELRKADLHGKPVSGKAGETHTSYHRIEKRVHQPNKGVRYRQNRSLPIGSGPQVYRAGRTFSKSFFPKILKDPQGSITEQHQAVAVRGKGGICDAAFAAVLTGLKLQFFTGDIGSC